MSSPYIQVGSVLLFDDWNNFCADDNRGERKAFAEYQIQSDQKFEKWFSYHYSGQAFLCTAIKQQK